MFDPSLSTETSTNLPAGGTIWHIAWRWLDRYQRQLVIAALVLQLAVLGSMIVIHCLPLWIGRRILVPVNLGDSYSYRDRVLYFTYDFSKPPKDSIEGIPTALASQSYEVARWLKDRPIYVTLELESGTNTFRPVKWSMEQPKSGVYLRGRADDSYSYNEKLIFGIEAYSVSDDEQAAIQTAITSGTAQAEIAVTSSGQAKLVRVK